MARIVLICDTFAPNVGGSEAVLLDMARWMHGCGHGVTVFTPASREPAADEARFDAAEPYRIVRSRVWSRLFRMGGSPRPLLSRLARAGVVIHVFWRVLRLGRCDCLVAGHPLPLGNVAQALKRVRGAPYVLMTYGEDVAMYMRGTRMRAMLIEAIRNADAVTCLTDAAAGEIAALVPGAAGRIHVCPPPADPSIRDCTPAEIDAVRRMYGLADKRVLLTVCRLVPRKGVDVVLQAVASLADAMPDLVYVIVGVGDDRARLEALALQLGIASRIVFAGMAPSTRPYYHACDVFVMVNREMESGEREGYGIVFVEAGYACKPVIGGRSGGAAAAIVDGATGLLVDPTSPGEVAGAIRTLMTDRAEAERLGRGGLRFALERHSPEAVHAHLDKMLGSVLGSQPIPTEEETP